MVGLEQDGQVTSWKPVGIVEAKRHLELGATTLGLLLKLSGPLLEYYIA